MLRRFFFASVVGLIATAALPNVPNAAAADPSAFIDDLDAQLQHLIRDTSPDQRFVRFRQIFRADFDVPGIARFVLGPYWRLASPAQQQEFLALFENYIVQTFSGRLSQYAESGDAPRVTGSRLDPEGAVVSSQINLANGGGPRAGGHGPTVLPIRVDWHLTAQNGSYKINDVVVDGISMAVTQRSEFTSAIERQGGQVQALLATLHQQTPSALPQ
jgi:phospholipid transport system substrate-binding protein